MEIILGIALVGALIFWVYLIKKARGINDVKDTNVKLENDNLIATKANDFVKKTVTDSDLTDKVKVQAIKGYFGIK